MLIFVLIFLFLLAIVWYIMNPNCPACNKKVFKRPDILDTKFTDTTPRKKDGSHDKRYNKSGYWSKLKKWTCDCGHVWQKWV